MMTNTVNDLVDKVETIERFDYRPSRELREYSDGTKPLPGKRRMVWKTRGRGLLTQLGTATGHRPVVEVTDDQVITWCSLLDPNRAKSQRWALAVTVDALPLILAPLDDQPSPTFALEQYLAIVKGIGDLRARVRQAAGRDKGKNAPPATALREIVGLVLEVDGKGGHVVTDRAVRDAAHEIRSWRSQARIALGYDVEIIRLRERHCLECRGWLYVRKDASSDVWCRPPNIVVAGPEREGEPFPVRWIESCGAIWPRSTWLQLLPDIRPDERTAS